MDRANQLAKDGIAHLASVIHRIETGGRAAALAMEDGIAIL